MHPFVERKRRLAYERAGLVEKGPEKTLVIVDMQDVYVKEGPDQKKLVSVICRLIEYARQQKWGIIILEYNGHTYPTDIDIINAIEDYPYQATINKTESNGGKEVIDFINDHPVWSFDLLICGLYGDECVSDTIAGLFDNSDLVEVTVINDAVYPNYCSSSERDEYSQQKESEISIEEVCGVSA